MVQWGLDERAKTFFSGLTGHKAEPCNLGSTNRWTQSRVYIVFDHLIVIVMLVALNVISAGVICLLGLKAPTACGARFDILKNLKSYKEDSLENFNL